MMFISSVLLQKTIAKEKKKKKIEYLCLLSSTSAPFTSETTGKRLKLDACRREGKAVGALPSSNAA